MIVVQILRDYKNRTEYKVLEKFIAVKEVNIDSLSEGILLLPGILLDKLEKKELEVLNKWLNIPDNQLILSPAWKEVSLNDYFDLSLVLKVQREEGLEFEGVECQYKIDGKIQEKFFSNEHGNFGVHYRKDTGSGLLTVITLPLLDYKLSHKHDEAEMRQYIGLIEGEKNNVMGKAKEERNKLYDNDLISTVNCIRRAQGKEVVGLNLASYPSEHTYGLSKKVIEEKMNIAVKEVNIDSLSEGILLLPGILLDKLEKKELEVLNKWLNIPDNQLILSPAWKEVSLNDYFDLSLVLKVQREEGLKFEGVECQYKIDGKIQEKFFSNEHGNFGVHYRKDTGSGLLTVITLPLLDYKLSHKHDEFKQYFYSCISKKRPKNNRQSKEPKEFEISEEHLQLFMLFAAGVKNDNDIQEAFNQYFNKNINWESIKSLEEVLTQQGLIDSRDVSDKGKLFIKEKRLKSFIKVLERRESTNEW
jgi:hypothetical protein